MDKPKLIKVSKKNAKMTEQGLMVKVNDQFYVLLENAPGKEPEPDKKPGKVRIPVETPGNKNTLNIIQAFWGIVDDDGKYTDSMEVTDKLQAKTKGDKLKFKADVVTLGGFANRGRGIHSKKMVCQVAYTVGDGEQQKISVFEGNEVELPTDDDDKWTDEDKQKAADAVKKLADSKLSEEERAAKAVAELVGKKKEEEPAKTETEIETEQAVVAYPGEIWADMKVILLLADKDPSNHKPAFYAVPHGGIPREHGPFHNWIKAKEHGDKEVNVHYYQVMNMGNNEIRVQWLTNEGTKKRYCIFTKKGNSDYELEKEE